MDLKKKIRLGDTLGIATSIAMQEGSKTASAVILGTTKTFKESTLEQKALIGSAIGNLLAGTLNLDTPFVNLGMSAGVDSFIDNASDVLALGAIGSLGYKLSKNISAMNDEETMLKYVEEQLGLIEDEIEEEPKKVVQPVQGIDIDIDDLTEEQKQKLFNLLKAQQNS